MSDSLIVRDGSLLALPDGSLVTDKDGAPCCCDPVPCPFYWRAEHCALPGCYVYICSDVTCANGEPIADGTVFEFNGGCYRVQGGKEYPTPPPGGVVVEAKTVVCKGSCNECSDGECEGPDCRLIGHSGNFGVLGSACGNKPPFQCCFGKGTKFVFSGTMITRQPNRVNQWEWTGTGEGSPWPSIKAAVTLRYRRWLFDSLVIDETFLIDWDFGGTGWAFAPVFQSPYGETTSWKTACSIAVGCGGSTFSGYTVGNGGVKIDEGSVTLKVVPGNVKCGPVCPSPMIESDLPGENPPGNPGNPGAVNDGGGCGACGGDGGYGLGEALP